MVRSDAGSRLSIAPGQCPAPDRPLSQQRQPRAKHRGLEFVETAVHTGLDMSSALTLSAVAKLADTRCQGFVARNHRTTVAKPPRFFVG